MNTTIEQEPTTPADLTEQAPFSQEQIKSLVEAKGGISFPAKIKDRLTRTVYRLKWQEWTQILTADQIKTVDGYAKWLFGSKSPFSVLKDEEKKIGKKRKAVLCSGLIDRRLSVLRPKGSPSHHSDHRVNNHFNSFDSKDYGAKLPEITKAEIAHHLFDLDTTLYYVSNSSGAASHALLAFDIDAKMDDATGLRPNDAIFCAEAIRDFMDWGDDFCRIQPSTSGFGAYVYFIVNYDDHKAKKVNDCIKRLRNVVSDALQPNFMAFLDAIKGDIPIFAKTNGSKTILSQGNLVRLPVVENLKDLNSFIALRPVPFDGLVQFITLHLRQQTSDSLRSPSEHPTESTPPSDVSLDGSSSVNPEEECSLHLSSCSSSSLSSSLSSSPLSPLSLSTRITNARKPCTHERKKCSNTPLKRVYDALKDFRDKNKRDPKEFEEFDEWYEGLRLNTGRGEEDRENRFDIALKTLGPYRQNNYTRFDEQDYKWVETHISEDDLKEEGRARKQALRMIELKLTQYVIGLATAQPQKGVYDFGCPMNRIKEMHAKLHKEGLFTKEYGKNGRNRYGCYVRLLIGCGLVEMLEGASYVWHIGRKLMVTEIDEVFGSKCQKRIEEARQNKSQNAHVFVQKRKAV